MRHKFTLLITAGLVGLAALIPAIASAGGGGWGP
jgi:hypothetical protein